MRRAPAIADRRARAAAAPRPARPMPPAKRGLSNSPSREYNDVGGGEGGGGLDIVLACSFFEVRGTTSPNFAERDFVDATTLLLFKDYPGLLSRISRYTLAVFFIAQESTSFPLVGSQFSLGIAHLVSFLRVSCQSQD